MGRRILITGGAGNVGASLARGLLRDPDNAVTVIDDLSTGEAWKLPPPTPNFTFVQADANDWQDIAPVFTAGRFDHVFHYAAVVGVQRTLDNPLDVLDDIKGIENILRLAKSTGVRRVFFSSSSEVYGEPVEIPQHEDTTPLNARLPYAIVKNVGEAYLRSFRQTFGLDYTILRFFNTYGPLQSKDFVVSKFIRLALAGDPITVYGDGAQTRTFCHANDNIDFTLKLLDADMGINQTINVGSDAEITVLELARTIIRLTGSTSEIRHLPPLPEGDMTRRKPDISRMKAILGRDLIPLEEGLQDCIAALSGG